MFITAVCVIWLKTKSLHDTMTVSTDALKFALLQDGKLSHYNYLVFPSVFNNIIMALKFLIRCNSGEVPYPTMTSSELCRRLKVGYRMERPHMCCDEV